jgi:hypothetical protein
MNEADGHAHMEYWGNHAKQTLSLTLRQAGEVVDNESGYGEESFLLPLTRELDTYLAISAESSCEQSVSGITQHEAWHEAFTPVGMYTWGRAARPSQGIADSAPCVPVFVPSGGGGGEGGDEWYICYYTNLFIGDTLVSTELLGCVPLH